MTPAELRRVRLRLGLSQEKLAQELHVNRLSVLRWEGGLSRIPFMFELALQTLEQKIAEGRPETKEGSALRAFSPASRLTA